MLSITGNLRVYTDFESGNFIVDELSYNKVIGRIQKDGNNKDFQWFHFDIETDRPSTVHIHIKNILQSSYPTAWNTFKVAILQMNDKKWTFTDTKLDGTDLCFNVTISGTRAKIAYFIPFSLHDHSRISNRIKMSPYFEHLFEATTPKGNKLEIFKLSDKSSSAKNNLWIISRQHPGETIVCWFMDKIISTLDLNLTSVKLLFKKFNIFLIHNANPDGTLIGSHRTTAEGIDPNRDWVNEESMEIKTIKTCINSNPPNIFIDLHGDERTLHPYISTNSAPGKYEYLFRTLKANLPEIEIRHQDPSKPDLNISRNYIEKYYNCLSLTLEFPCQMHIDYTGDIIQSVQTMASNFIKSFVMESHENPILA